MVLLLMKHGSGGGEVVVGGGGGRVGFMWEGQSPECKTTVHASFKQAHAPFKYKKNTLCNVECGTRA